MLWSNVVHTACDHSLVLHRLISQHDVILHIPDNNCVARIRLVRILLDINTILNLFVVTSFVRVSTFIRVSNFLTSFRFRSRGDHITAITSRIEEQPRIHSNQVEKGQNPNRLISPRACITSSVSFSPRACITNPRFFPRPHSPLLLYNSTPCLQLTHYSLLPTNIRKITFPLCSGHITHEEHHLIFSKYPFHLPPLPSWTLPPTKKSPTTWQKI